MALRPVQDSLYRTIKLAIYIDYALAFRLLTLVLLQDGLTLYKRLFKRTLEDLSDSKRSGAYLERLYRHLRMI